MKQEGHLKSYHFVLTAISPVFIGSGEVSPKYGYLFDKKNLIVSMLDEKKLMETIIKIGKVDQFEKAVLGHRLSSPDDMYHFLNRDCALRRADIHQLVRYNCDAGAALDENHQLMDIQLFIRHPDGTAYIPGSSLKGALRTVILFHLMQQSHRLGSGQKFERKIPEEEFLNTLHLKRDRDGKTNSNEQVNSIMRGIEISDSAVIPDKQMTLCRKIDIKPGTENSESSPNVCRECIKPGTTVEFALTADESILKCAHINVEDFPKWMDQFSDYYKENYERFFSLPDGGIHASHCLIIGGGSGFFSKTLTYPYYGEKDALDMVSAQMSRSFKKHHHEKDRYLGISPHTMKYTEYDGKRYPMGVCEVELS